MYARRDGIPISILPDELHGLDDAELAKYGFYHVRESLPEGYSPDQGALTTEGAEFGFDPDGAIPVVTMEWAVRPFTEDEVRARKDAHNAPILDELAVLDAKRIRPLTDVALGVGDVVGEDGKTSRQRLIDLEAEAEVLRLKIRGP